MSWLRSLGLLLIVMAGASAGQAFAQNGQWLLPIVAQTSDDPSVLADRVTLGVLSNATDGWEGASLEPLTPLTGGLSLRVLHSTDEPGYQAAGAVGTSLSFHEDFRARFHVKEEKVFLLELSYSGSLPAVQATLSWPKFDTTLPNEFTAVIGSSDEFAVGGGTNLRTNVARTETVSSTAPVLLEVHLRKSRRTLGEVDRVGDLNGDGVFNALDLVTALDLFFGKADPTPDQLEQGDVQPVSGGNVGDNAIRSNDLNDLLRRFLGVIGEASVVVSPQFVTLNGGDVQNFSGQVVGFSDPSVTWSVAEGAAGGSITPTGQYTAPGISGFYQIVASSHTSPLTQHAVAVAKVTASPVVKVDIQSFAFNASTLTVARGTKVIWTNKDQFTHTVTSGAPPDPNSDPVADGKFNSGNLGAGATFEHTFNEAGKFPYFCIIHKFMVSMRGKVIVQ